MLIIRLFLWMKVTLTFPETQKVFFDMTFLLIIIMILAWLPQALKDGARK